MNLFKALLDDEAESALGKLIGTVFYQLYAPYVQVEKELVEAPSFSISIKGQWINIYNTWLETPEDTPYYRLKVESGENPLGLEYSPDKKMFLRNPSSFLFNRGGDNQEVERIEIYTTDEIWGEERVVYDSAIIFYIKNGNKFIIRAVEDIADQVECTIQEAAIEEVINNFSCRLTID